MSSTVSSSAFARGSSVHASRTRSCLLPFVLDSAFVAAMLSSAACMSAPEPPPTPRGILQLSERYDHLTADLDRVTAQRIVDRRPPEYDALEALAGLTFLRDVLSDVGLSAADGTDLPIEVQGTLSVHAPCPGWEPKDGSRPDEAETGFVELTLGVDGSRVQRAFTGAASRCKFAADRLGRRAAVTVSMALEVDLGHSFVPGEPLPPLLVHASDVRISKAGGDLGGSTKEFSVRMDAGDVLETLIELESLGLGRTGTFLLALREDGRSRLRGRDDAWLCGRQRSEPCVPTP
jgi:hypothetical protein